MVSTLQEVRKVYDLLYQGKIDLVQFFREIDKIRATSEMLELVQMRRGSLPRHLQKRITLEFLESNPAKKYSALALSRKLNISLNTMRNFVLELYTSGYIYRESLITHGKTWHYVYWFRHGV